MSSPMNHRRGRLSEKSSSFHSNTTVAGTMSGVNLRRPKTVAEVVFPRQPPKLLVKVTMMGSLGPVQVVLPPESAVGDLVAAAVRQFVKEGRRPFLPSTDPSNFDLHYSQFSLESLNRREKLGELGSRNFFMCLKKSTVAVDGGEGSETAPFASCSKEAVKGRKGSGGFSWMKLMDLLK
ncbi:hypothetical protein Lal_00019343 [Lupinus albus]|uniref:DUF7054 domain-containing protein n=1 Tax=Lupinus albus TaxID=3870 RepID=A0A6A4R1H4_LUPAL|nr:hypothetical protein Lalb_Chr01g0004741 [Lupinus albus]KAF1899219.1 hypothetical protein Lal_00019343 [Lupinus albus]